MGRFMLAKRPPLSLSHSQTLGGTYSSAEFDLSSLMVTPWLCVYMYAVKEIGKLR